MDDAGFSVSLSFDASRQRVGVPWEALTAFVDPAAEFALRFSPPGTEDEEPSGEDGQDGLEGGAAGSADATADVVSIDRFKKRDD